MMALRPIINPYGEAIRPSENEMTYSIPDGWHLALSPTAGAYVASVLRQGRNKLTADELDSLWPIYRREHEYAVVMQKEHCNA